MLTDQQWESPTKRKSNMSTKIHNREDLTLSISEVPPPSGPDRTRVGPVQCWSHLSLSQYLCERQKYVKYILKRRSFRGYRMTINFTGLPLLRLYSVIGLYINYFLSKSKITGKSLTKSERLLPNVYSKQTRYFVLSVGI